MDDKNLPEEESPSDLSANKDNHTAEPNDSAVLSNQSHQESQETVLPPQEKSDTPQPHAVSKKRLPILIAAAVSLMVLIGVAVFVIMQILGPGQVKEKLSVGHPVYKDYNKAITNIAEYLLDDSSSGFDSDAIERAAQKEQTLLKAADDSKKTLNSLLENQKKVGQLEKYNKLVDQYISESEIFIKLQKDNLSFSKGFVRPMSRYEELTVALSDSSQYLYSNPAKYVESLNAATNSLDEIINQVSEIKIEEPDMKDVADVFIQKLKSERDFLKAMAKAVEERDSIKIGEAQKEYASSSQNIAKDASRVQDRFEQTVKEKSDMLESIRGEIDDEYSNLKNKYNF